MIKIKEVKKTENNCEIKKISEMESLEVGCVLGEFCRGQIIMRSRKEDFFLGFDLSDPDKNAFWESDSNLEVEVFPKGTLITLEVI